MGKKISRLPESVVVRVVFQIVPEGYFVFEVEFIDIRKGSQIEKELVAVAGWVLEAGRGIGGWFWAWFTEGGEEVKSHW